VSDPNDLDAIRAEVERLRAENEELRARLGFPRGPSPADPDAEESNLRVRVAQMHEYDEPTWYDVRFLLSLLDSLREENQ